MWAHPDDETYLSAALMATAVRAGQRVVCLTATRGELGSWDESRWPTSKLGAIREEELMRCLAHLGVTEHHWLGYPDGGCDAVPREEAVVRVERFIAGVRPDTVLCFGPDGMTGHADHKATCAWTTEAFARAAKPGAKLYYATQTKDWADRWVPVFNRFDVFAEGPPLTPEGELAIRFDFDAELAELKLGAISEHVSQVQGMMNAFGPDVFREAMLVEKYRLAATA